MYAGLMRALKEAEGNVYGGVSFINGAIVSVWTLLCLFLVNKSRSFEYAAALGAAYYLVSIGLYIYLFKGINKYLSFPGRNKKMPIFIGHKLDIFFTYPILLMAIIGIISNLLAATGLFPVIPQQTAISDGTSGTAAVRAMLLPLPAFAEELMNLLLASMTYKLIRLKGNYRIIAGILPAALIFGSLHTFGQGFSAAASIGIAYIPVFFATLYTGNIWISFLAHLYSDLIALAKAYNSGLHIVITAAVSLIPALWAIRAMLRRTR